MRSLHSGRREQHRVRILTNRGRKGQHWVRHMTAGCRGQHWVRLGVHANLVGLLQAAATRAMRMTGTTNRCVSPGLRSPQPK